MKKRLFSFFGGIVFTLTFLLCTTAVMAANGISIDIFTDISVKINGEDFYPTDAGGNPVLVFSHNGTTYAPLRALAEAYGLYVDYDEQTQTATVDEHAPDLDDGAEQAISTILELFGHKSLESFIESFEVFNLTSDNFGLSFANTSELTVDHLLRLFVFSLGTEISNEVLEQYAYNSLKTEITVPIDDIKAKLDNFLEDYNLDLSEIENTERYTLSNGKIVFSNFDGSGGTRFLQTDEIAFIDNELQISVLFFEDDSQSEVSYTKHYTFSMHENGFYISSIAK